MHEKHVVENSSGSHSGDLPPFRKRPLILQKTVCHRTTMENICSDNELLEKKTIIRAELPGGCPASDPRGVGDRNTDRATAHPTHSNSYITHLSCLTPRSRSQPISRAPAAVCNRVWSTLGVDGWRRSMVLATGTRGIRRDYYASVTPHSPIVARVSEDRNGREGSSDRSPGYCCGWLNRR